MTKDEQNQIIKDAWVHNLKKQGDIPKNIGEIYKNWLLEKVREANAQLNEGAAQQQEQQQQQQQSQQQSA